MRILTIVVLLTVAFLGTAFAAVDPAAALAEAKSLITAKKYGEAVAVIDPAIEAAGVIADPAQQKAAQTALHFYAAVALDGLMKSKEALGHLEAAMRLSPNMRNIDPQKYSNHFVSLFEQARSATATEAKPESAGTGRFDELYPGFLPTDEVRKSDVWEAPAIEFLASKQEKRAWHDASAPVAREQFMETFWTARDHTPGTAENEFRDMFQRRAAFAERTFGVPGTRGALSDRGRVFALLGEPALVRRRALNRDEARELVAVSRSGLGIEVGTVEYWIYNREQLPVGHPAPTVTFRFVSHQGIGHYVLQRDGVPINLLSTASSASREPVATARP